VVHFGFMILYVLDNLFHMYGIIFVCSLRGGTLCVYYIILDILFHMHETIFVKYSLRCGTLCVYDIIMDLVCLMMYGIIYIDLEMYYERYIRLYEIDKSLQKTFFFL
jgi:hypothetical protein